jgi:Ca-activated chloride channel family protein
MLLFAGVPTTWRVRMRGLPVTLRWGSLGLIALCLTSPSCKIVDAHDRHPGLDVLLLLDVSQSMRARDEQPDRIGRARALAAQLVTRRPGDRIGLVLFAGAHTLACPFTTDHAALLSRLARVEASTGTGTALGTALLGSLARFKEAHAAGGAVVVLTDGAGALGEPMPTDAARLGAFAGLHVMTVMVGTSGRAPYPTEFGLVTVDVEANESVLAAMAEAGRGVFVRGASPDAIDVLDAALDRIERAESSGWREQTVRLRSIATVLISAAATTIAAELLLSCLILRLGQLRQRRVHQAIVLGAWIGCVTAAGVSAWGPPMERSPRNTDGAVVFALDVSRSMDARDLEVTRQQAAIDVVRGVASSSSRPIALVAFAGSAELICPATRDAGAVRMALAEIGQISGALEYGSAIAAGVVVGLQAIVDTPGSKALILLSDGEETTEELDDAIAQAVAQHVPIHTVGLGTPRGESMAVDRSGTGERRVTALDESRLRRLAERTGGHYVAWRGADTTKAVTAWVDSASQPGDAIPELGVGVRLLLLAAFLFLSLQLSMAMYAMTER